MKKEDFVSNFYTFLLAETGKIGFSENDLLQVKRLVASSLNVGDRFVSNELIDLRYLPNLEELELNNYIINRPNISSIIKCEHIQKYSFFRCDFKDKLNIEGKYLSAKFCEKIENITFERFENVEIQGSDISKIKLDRCKLLKIDDCTRNC